MSEGEGQRAGGAAVQVAVCEDSIGFRALVQSWLTDDPRLALAVIAESGAELERALAEMRPDVLLLDLVLPDVDDSPALVARLRERHPGLPIVLMSSLQTGELERAAADARADAFAHKATTGPALCDLLLEVARRPRGPVGG